VLFAIPALHGGGAERVFVTLLRHIDRTAFEPRLALFFGEGEYLEGLPSDLPRTVLAVRSEMGSRRCSTAPVRLAWRLSRVIRREEPEVILSFMWYTNAVVLLARSLARHRCGVVVSERYGLLSSQEGRVEEALRRTVIRWLYPRADQVIVNALEMGSQLADHCQISTRRISAIHNPVDIARVLSLAAEPAEHPWFGQAEPVIVGAGRLTAQKGFEYLVRAVARVNEQGTPCRLMILGQGPEEKSLRAMAHDVGIPGRVSFAGFQENPYAFFAKASTFVLSSLYEGFPNALLEAMTLGLPCVATRCPTGPAEILTDGVDGLLVPPADPDALADALSRLLQDPALRGRLGEAARARAGAFAVQKIVARYESVLECAALRHQVRKALDHA
jgi:glycosyltransferase involved in cell wall biosynthesis